MVGGGQPVGEEEIAAVDGLADLKGPLPPPGGGTHALGAQAQEKPLGALVQPLAPPPLQAIEDEPGIIAERRRNGLDGAVHVGAHRLDAQPRQSEVALAGIDEAEHAAGLLVLAVPEQPVQPGQMVLGPKEIAIAPEDELLLARGCSRPRSSSCG